ncbi:MAG TPA: hypothetical protein DD723_09830 [Candidatus Omnitrophica bacterium]|nr:MAG: hypothetical protein A2Z81_06285 [Omnitrophica WOR_2 bacterium GWA2_45_18]HBR15818.1 hypothetical protein [Candidatus Omnitrophota bacterium]
MRTTGPGQSALLLKNIAWLISGFLFLLPGDYLFADAGRDKEWVTCQSFQDCVVIIGTCDWTCVNQTFRTEAEQYYKELRTRVRCAEPGYQSAVFAHCQENTCCCQGVPAMPSEYYQGLSKECAKGDGCCQQSVNHMSKHQYPVMPEEGCPEGFQQNLLRCITSYTWCEPIKK